MTGCASWDRAVTDMKSDVNGGMQRTITVYTADGKELATYEGKIDIDTNDGGYVKFDFDGNGYTYSRNKIWSKNTGRNDYGEMVGTIVDIKDKVELQLPPLTGEQALLLDNVVSDIDNPFPTAQVLFLGGQQKEMTIYTGDVTYPYLTRAKNEDGLIVGAKLSLIQK